MHVNIKYRTPDYRMGTNRNKSLHLIKPISQPMRFWYLSDRGAAQVQTSLRINDVSLEPLLLVYTKQ